MMTFHAFAPGLKSKATTRHMAPGTHSTVHDGTRRAGFAARRLRRDGAAAGCMVHNPWAAWNGRPGASGRGRAYPRYETGCQESGWEAVRRQESTCRGARSSRRPQGRSGESGRVNTSRTTDDCQHGGASTVGQEERLVSRNASRGRRLMLDRACTGCLSGRSARA